MSGTFGSINMFQEDESIVEKEVEIQKTEEGVKPKGHHRLQFLHSCPLTSFLHHPKAENGKYVNYLLF